MNKHDARKIAEMITNQQLQDMFECAKDTITDWTKVSNVNKSFTKGAVWNILIFMFVTATGDIQEI